MIRKNQRTDCFKEMWLCSISKSFSEKEKEAMWSILNEEHAIKEWILIPPSQEFILFQEVVRLTEVTANETRIS